MPRRTARAPGGAAPADAPRTRTSTRRSSGRRGTPHASTRATSRRSTTSVSGCPFIDKDAVRRFRDERGDPYGGLLCVAPAELTAMMSTSGTTGDPTLVAEHWGGGGGGGRRSSPATSGAWAAPRRPRRARALHVPRADVRVDPGTRRGAGPLRLRPRARSTGCSSCRSSTGRRSCTTSVRSSSTRCATSARGRGFDPRRVRVVPRRRVGGRAARPRARALAEEWGVALFEHTGVGDVTASFECHAHDGLHFWEDTALVEGIDPDGTAPMADGERCELVATSLFNRIAPLIRYRSDDIVRLTHDPCGCGRTHARVWPIGRKGDEIVVQGRPVLPIDVWAAVESVDACAIGLFQVIRSAREVDALRLRVGYAAAYENRLETVRRRRARRGRGRDRPRSRRRARARTRSCSARSAAQDPAGGPAMTETLWGVGCYEDGTRPRPLGDLARRRSNATWGARRARSRRSESRAAARAVLLDALRGRAVLAAHDRRDAVGRAALVRRRQRRRRTPGRDVHFASSTTTRCSA